jgi:V/A-type H+/Na+-transporting ATPase subunit I
MSIARLRKLTLAGLLLEKTQVLEQLQALGCLHLVSLAGVHREPEESPPQHAVDARRALRYLTEVPNKRRQVRSWTGFDMNRTVTRVLASQQRLRTVTDRRDALVVRIAMLEPWGDFSLPPADALAGCKLWFYIVPERQMHLLDVLTMPWQVVHKDNRQSWVAVIDPEEPPRDALPVPRTHTGAVSLNELVKQLEETELELEDAEAERLALTRWIYLMSRSLDRAEDQAVLRHAEAQTLDAETLFLVQGWVAETAVARVTALAEGYGLAVLLEDPEPADRPPTLLDNPEHLAAGEDLVGFYQMPAYGSWDPSPVLFFSFAIFFAMILADAGYAAVLGVLLAIYWRRLEHSDIGRRLRTLCLVLVGGSLVYGVLVGSYFGLSPPPETLRAHLKILDVNDFDTMMKLTVAIGVLHLVLANVQQAVLKRSRVTAWAHIGWIGVMLGGFALWLGGVEGAPHWLGSAGRWTLGLGLGAVFAFGSERPVRDARSALLWVLDGLQGLSNVTKIFGDVLSYLRLFALGLASASLAITFNDLARQVTDQVPGLGLLFALLILLVGHVLNLLLSVMSGVVHGLRLNFIEFYNWALLGEGYPFRPFRKKETNE